MFFLKTFLSVPWQDVNGDGYVYKNLNKGVPDKQGSSCRANIHSFQRKNQTNKQKTALGYVMLSFLLGSQNYTALLI